MFHYSIFAFFRQDYIPTGKAENSIRNSKTPSTLRKPRSGYPPTPLTWTVFSGAFTGGRKQQNTNQSRPKSNFS